MTSSENVEKQNGDYCNREMFCFETRFEIILVIICLSILESKPVLSCAGTRIPRRSHCEEDGGCDWRPSGRDATKFEYKNSLPKGFWLGCKDWGFINVCYGHLAGLQPIYIVYGCVVGALGVLVVDVLDYYLLNRERNGRVPLLCQLASIIYWLFCVIFAPLLYWPELAGPIYQEVMITRERSPVTTQPRRQEKTVSTSTRTPTPPRRQKDKYVQTSGPSSKKYLKQIREYETILTGCHHERTAKLKKTARMLQQFRTKWKGYMDELQCKNKLIDDALAETIRLERQVVFLHDACALLREQLKTQQTVNKGVLQRYQDMHKQVLGYLGQTDITQHGQNVYGSRLDSSGV